MAALAIRDATARAGDPARRLVRLQLSMRIPFLLLPVSTGLRDTARRDLSLDRTRFKQLALGSVPTSCIGHRAQHFII